MVTLKDIAEQAKVSIATVHKCIYGKPGVSEETRSRVLATVDEMGYVAAGPNTPKRKGSVRLAVVCPDRPMGENSFYLNLQQGAGKAARELEAKGSQVQLHLCDGTWTGQARLLEQLAQREDLDGVAVCCLDDANLQESLSAFQRKDIPVVTFNSDAPADYRLAYVTPPNQRMGALAAELLCKMGCRQRLLIVGGDKKRSNLRGNNLGFFTYIQQHAPEVSLLEINSTGSQDLGAELEKVLTSLDDVTGIYCSMTQNSMLVCKLLQKIKPRHHIRLICTDVFPNLRPFLADGTVDATLWQAPRAQSYNAVYLLYHYLLTGKLRKQYFNIPIAPVMFNNFEDFL